MNKNIANLFVLSTLLTAGLVIGTAFAEDAAPAEKPMETAQATTPESAAKTEPVKVDEAKKEEAKPAADASASAPASPATTPAVAPSPAASPAPEKKEEAPAAPAAPAESHK